MGASHSEPYRDYLEKLILLEIHDINSVPVMLAVNICELDGNVATQCPEGRIYLDSGIYTKSDEG